MRLALLPSHHSARQNLPKPPKGSNNKGYRCAETATVVDRANRRIRHDCDAYGSAYRVEEYACNNNASPGKECRLPPWRVRLCLSDVLRRKMTYSDLTYWVLAIIV